MLQVLMNQNLPINISNVVSWNAVFTISYCNLPLSNRKDFFFVSTPGHLQCICIISENNLETCFD